MDSIAVKNFRCFQSTGDIALRPLTLLVGENSSGKTSFLAAARLAWDTAYSSRPLDFNEEPFLLGAYDQIAHYRGGKAGRAKSFDITSSVSVRPPRHTQPTSSERVPLRFKTTLRQSGSHAVIENQSVEYAGYALTADFSSPDSILKIQYSSPERTVSLPVMGRGRNYRFSSESPIEWGLLIFLLMRPTSVADVEASSKSNLTEVEKSVLDDIMRHTRSRRKDRPVALAPVRSRPARTYNPVSAAPLPEGDHIPMVLAKTYFDDKAKWDLVRDALHKFGMESGLFDELDIKALGRSESDPFQLRVKIQGPPANLVDVGYGVSQVLPILVDSILANRGDTFLVQQPEVHLHPRAQAALGSFLVRMAAEQGKRFVIESHSDFLIDRIRTEMRDNRRLKANDVSLLFFEKSGLDVTVHDIRMDQLGNLTNIPPGFRSFFLNEERRVLGI